MRFKKLAVAFALSALATSAAYAQASRTWVSGVGDDANPCSRTAPCKTFAGAISKTAPGGEIDTLDPGGFGGVTITKSLTIDGIGGGESSILVSGTNGITISAASTDFVNLRNIQINGIQAGLNGVRVVNVGRLNMDNVAIFGFTQRSVSIESTVNCNVEIRNCNFWNAAGSGFTVITPSGTPAIKVVIDHTNITNNGGTVAGTGFGIFTSAGGGSIRLIARDSNISQNSAANVTSDSAQTTIFLDNCTMAEGLQEGVKGTSGGTVFIARSSIYANAGNAITNATGSVFTYGDNYMANNGSNNTGTAAVPAKQ
jgi:hypothetical protein